MKDYASFLADAAEALGVLDELAAEVDRRCKARRGRSRREKPPWADHRDHGSPLPDTADEDDVELSPESMEKMRELAQHFQPGRRRRGRGGRSKPAPGKKST